MDELCPVHQQPFKQVPAGISKSTGKPYSAFMACPERGCREKPQQQMRNPYPQRPATPPKENRNWDKEAYEKTCSIFTASLLSHQNGEILSLQAIEAGVFWKLFQAIRADADKRFATGWNKAEATFRPNPVQTVAAAGQGQPAPSDDYEAGNRALDELGL